MKFLKVDIDSEPLYPIVQAHGITSVVRLAWALAILRKTCFS